MANRAARLFCRGALGRKHRTGCVARKGFPACRNNPASVKASHYSSDVVIHREIIESDLLGSRARLLSPAGAVA